MSADDAGLAALEFHRHRSDRWQDEVTKILRNREMDVDPRGGRWRVVAWPKGLKEIDSSLRFRDGYVVNRVKLAPGRSALGVNPRRLYFDGAGEPIVGRPERDILEDHPSKPGKATDETLFAGTLELLEHIASAKQAMFGSFVKLPAPTIGMEECCEVSVGRQKISAKNLNLNKLYRAEGFDFVPEEFGVYIVPFRGLTEEAEKFKKILAKDLRVRHIEPHVEVLEWDRIERRVNKLDSGARKKVDPAKALLLLLPPKKNKNIPKQCFDLMAGLDRNSVPWLRAYGDDSFDYSVTTQVPSILQAAGGRPHRTWLADESRRLPWSIGIDLSHKAESTLCVSLVDPYGLRQGAWCSPHSRNEEIEDQRLRRLLQLATQVVREHDDEPEILMVRDGRLFEKENCRAYRESLGIPVSLVEWRKYGNPQLFLWASSGPQLPDQAVWAPVPNSCCGFLVPSPKRARRTGVFKVWWDKHWDGLRLGGTGIAECLVALTFTPGLGASPGLGGSRRNSPAPIYWADGIAGASDSDLRFRGQSVVFVE